MSYLLDTNVCIQLLNNTNSALNERLRQEEPEDIYLCTVVQMELYYGAYRSLHRVQNLALLEPFFQQFTVLLLNPEAARIAGKIRSELAKLGTPIGPYDLQIAAFAKRPGGLSLWQTI